MARAKRPYTPKTKGCHECSQRRVNCDRGKPSCAKCISKGLECSGIGVLKYKFRNMFVLGQRTGPESTSNSYPPDGQASTTQTIFTPPVDSDAGDDDAQVSAAGDGGGLSLPSDRQGADLQGIVKSPDRGADRTTLSPSSPSPLALVKDHITPWQRLLLKHFSDHIAPEMVVIDDCNNGWRQMVLPLACDNEMVLNSVAAVAAFHLSERAAGAGLTLFDPAMLYSKAILELQKRRDVYEYDLEARYHIVVGIIVLLLGTMVNGSSDFPIIFHMLQSAVCFVGGEEALAASDQAIAGFLATQIRKMRVYASPFISQYAGVCAIATQENLFWDSQEIDVFLQPDQSNSLAVISSLRKLAFQIYLQRASATRDTALVSSSLVSRFRLMLGSFPEAVEGEHVLVWPVFMAASASRLPEHQTYFARFLERQFYRSGFVNIQKALQSLSRIWTRDMEECWTTLLPEQVVFVM